MVSTRLAQGRMVLWHAASMLRKESVDLLGGYEEAILSGEDFHLFLGFVLAGMEVHCISETLIYYRNDPYTKSFRAWLRQELWNAYARYHRYALHSGKTPCDFASWCSKPINRLSSYSWHVARFLRSRLRLRRAMQEARA